MLKRVSHRMVPIVAWLLLFLFALLPLPLPFGAVELWDEAIGAVSVRASASSNSMVVLTMTHNEFASSVLPDMARQFGLNHDLDVRLIVAPAVEEAILRQFALDEPIDVIVVSYEKYLALRDVGWLRDVAEVVPELRPGGLVQTEQPARWMWGSVDGITRCGYVPGAVRPSSNLSEPSFVCLWGQSPDPQRAVDFIYQVVERAPTVESELTTARSFVRKLLVERDYTSLYEHLLHPDRKAHQTLDAFVKEMEGLQPCRFGEMVDVQMGPWERNDAHLVDPVTGTQHLPGSLMNVSVPFTCVMTHYDVAGTVDFIMAPEWEPAPAFYPYEVFNDLWGEG